MKNVTYRLPETLPGDIAKFATLAEGYVGQKVSATEFKAFRVPMGVYEQRKNEVYMARIRATGGLIHPAQLLSIIDIARSHGSNLLHLTTRQEIQIQNLELGQVEDILTRLSAEGLATKGGGGNTVRNIMVDEEAGLSADEPFDPTPYALELTSAMVAETDSYLLPRKMKIAFTANPGRVDYAAINDVGLVAQVRNGQRGFRVYVGGGAGSRPTVGWLLFDFMPVEDLYNLVKSLKRFFSDHGNRKNRSQARIRFIFYKNGAEQTLALIKQYFEEEKRERYVRLPLPERADERPQTDYQAITLPAELQADYALWRQRYVRAQRQEGYYSAVLPVILGNIWLTEDHTQHLVELLQFVRRFGEHTLRFTNTQNIRFRNLPEAALPELYTLVRPMGEEVGAPAIVNNIISCTGADTCRLGICFSKGLAGAIRRELLRSDLPLDRLADVAIHVTGCPNSCGQQLWADLGFAGRVLRNERAYPGYQVYLAANRVDQPRFAEVIGNLSARDVPTFVRRILSAYLETGSKYANFTAYLGGEGHDEAVRILTEYQEIPSFADDKNYYFDWDGEEIFTVASRGTAECSAGLFDMIKVDIDSIAISRKQFAETADAAKREQLIKDIVFSASRMLLVTRGLDPSTAAETYEAFIKNFIEAGYVEARFRSLVEAAAAGQTADFAERSEEAFALADAVTELYNGMDDSLQFKKKAPEAAAPAASEKAAAEAQTASEAQPAEKPAVASAEPAAADAPKRVKDLRGVACPMNFVRTKLELAQLQSGDILEVWLDDGQPINNVPGSVRNEGHTVLSLTPIENYWKVVIRKK
jgi:sulfite reductase (ferredoxin)